LSEPAVCERADARFDIGIVGDRSKRRFVRRRREESRPNFTEVNEKLRLVAEEQGVELVRGVVRVGPVIHREILPAPLTQRQACALVANEPQEH